MPNRTPSAAEIIAADILGRFNFPCTVLFLSGFIIVAFVLLPVPVRAQANAARPLKQDESCLACHGESGMKSDNGKSLAIDPAKHAASVHGTLGCTDCHTTIQEYPHSNKAQKARCATCHADEASNMRPAFTARPM